METCLDRVQRWLREQHAPYEVQHHRQAFTLSEVAAAVREKPDHVAKVVIAQAGGKLVMLVVPTSKRVDFKRVARLLDVPSATAAEEKDFEGRFPDCEPGAMPPFGHLYDLPLYVDEVLTRTSKLVFQAGTHRHTLKMATSDYLRLAQPITAQLTSAKARVAEHHGV
jgi:Ala-tRNA(Pro) deacylase